jgi:hypothetical protein
LKLPDTKLPTNTQTRSVVSSALESNHQYMTSYFQTTSHFDTTPHFHTRKVPAGCTPLTPLLIGRNFITNACPVLPSTCMAAAHQASSSQSLNGPLRCSCYARASWRALGMLKFTVGSAAHSGKANRFKLQAIATSYAPSLDEAIIAPISKQAHTQRFG